MKKRMISLCIMLTAMTVSMRAGVKIDATHFPDANFRKCLSDKRIDKNQDGYLNDEELDAVKELNLNNKGIKDLKGIEYFQELRELECHENELTSIDVSMQYNLKWFDCSYNKLTTLDVSHNPVLGALYCFSNKLTALDVSKNKYLTELYIAGNQIVGDAMRDLVLGMHDVNEGTAEFGVCSYGVSPDNIITVPQVNLAKDAGWRVMIHNDSGWVDYAGVSPGIDISSVNFPDENFRHIVESKAIDRDLNGFLTDDEIKMTTELALSKKNIKDLKGLEFFTNLMDLECANNSLTSLDLSKNTELGRLDCSYNSLTSLDLSKNTNLREVFCFSNKLTALDLSNNKNLGWLWIAGNQIMGDAMLKLVLSLPDKYDPKGELGVCVEGASPDNVITTQQVSLAKDRGWRVLMRGDTKWEDYAGVSPGLEINSTNFPDDIFRAIVESKAVDLDFNGFLTDEEIRQTKELSLRDKGIKDLKGLEFLTELVDLDCSYNSLTSLDVTKNAKLTRLDCSYNSGIKSLDLSKNTELREMYCFSCGLTALDVSNNKMLAWLYIAGNQIEGLPMQQLVLSLHDVYEGNGEFGVCFDGVSPDNVITAPLVGLAKDAGWRVLKFNGSKWEDYAGVSPGLDINATNFPDAFFRSIVSDKIIDQNQDGYLNDAELLAVTELEVSGKDIKDLKGIEYFTALKQLWCSGNSLTSLDVSKNTALTLLYCNVNNLTSLDVSKNISLTNLNCADNILTSLDVSKNLALKELFCQGNNITGDGMALLVNSLPIIDGMLYVCIKGNSPENVITVEQVKVANDKRWKVLGLDGDLWVEFTPDGIISIYNSDDVDGDWYNLNGQRIGTPSKGLYIHNGKKVVIK